MLKMDGLTNQTVSIQAYFKLKKLPVTSGDIPVTSDDINISMQVWIKMEGDQTCFFTSSDCTSGWMVY